MAGTVTHPASSLSKPGHHPGVVVLIIDPDLKNTLTSLLKHPEAPQDSDSWGKDGEGMVATAGGVLTTAWDAVLLCLSETLA